MKLVGRCFRAASTSNRFSGSITTKATRLPVVDKIRACASVTFASRKKITFLFLDSCFCREKVVNLLILIPLPAVQAVGFRNVILPEFFVNNFSENKCPLIFRVFSFVHSSLTRTREASLLRTEFPLFFFRTSFSIRFHEFASVTLVCLAPTRLDWVRLFGLSSVEISGLGFSLGNLC